MYFGVHHIPTLLLFLLNKEEGAISRKAQRPLSVSRLPISAVSSAFSARVRPLFVAAPEDHGLHATHPTQIDNPTMRLFDLVDSDSRSAGAAEKASPQNKQKKRIIRSRNPQCIRSKPGLEAILVLYSRLNDHSDDLLELMTFG